MYALIIARGIREGNTEQPIAVRSLVEWTLAGPNQHCTPTNDVYFAKHVKATTNNCLKMSKVGGKWNLMDPEQQPKTQRLTTKTKHLKYSQTLAAKQMKDDSKQDSSRSQLRNCQTIDVRRMKIKLQEIW